MQVRILCWLLILWMGLSAGVLAASVIHSPHDLSYTGSDQWDYHHDARLSTPAAQWNDYNEVCIYCHTPHNAQVSIPLWNRQLTNPSSFTPYQSVSMRAAPTSPSATSRLCLSCHDGTTALDAIGNIGSSPVWVGKYHSKMSGDCEDCHHNGNPTPNPECSGGGCHHVSPTNNYQGTVIGLDLSDDHPVSVPYLASAGLHPEPPDGKFPNGVRLFDGKVECSSCHNPHDPQNYPFLRIPNSGSALCYTCHDK